MLTNMMQWFVNRGADICGGITSILPQSPFKLVTGISIDNDILGFIAWIVPYPQIVSLLEAWGVAIAVYYGSMVILRWIKLLGD